MRLDLLLEREPFDRVFVDTISRFLNERYGWSGNIQWINAGLMAPTNALRANSKLNVIYPQNIKRNRLRELTAEYAYHPNLIRRLLQGLFVKWAIRWPFELLTTTAVIVIDPWPVEIDDWCIIPGNHSLRIVELDSGRCHVVAKSGFDQGFIANEISFRNRFTYITSPALYSADDDCSGYIEERIVALPWNRLSDIQVKNEILSKAQALLSTLYRETVQRYDLMEWTDGVRDQIEGALRQLPPVYDESDLVRIREVVSSLYKRIEATSSKTVDTVMSHGDFQPANILISPGQNTEQLFLIDFEYSGQRSYFYDSLVFTTQCRHPHGLSERVQLIMSGDFSDLPDWTWCSEEVESAMLEQWMIALFLLEDLLLRLEELRIPGLKSKSYGLNQFFVEVEKIRWMNS